MKNILFITNSLGFGGASKMLCFVAESLAERGYQVHIANRKATTDVTGYERVVSEKIQVHRIQGSGRWQELKQIIKTAKGMNADIIVGFTEMPNLMARLAAVRLGIPSVMSERGDPSRTSGTKNIKNGLVRRIINGSKGGVFQTEGAMKFYGKGLQKRGIVIPNPIFVKGEVPDVAYAEREKTVVSVGRLDNFQKRYDIMLQAFKLFHDKHPEYILKLYGNGSDVEMIKGWATELGLADAVQFMGLTKQPMQDIAKAGMFLITSDFEGISNSLLEAMAAGLPCVSTDHTPGGARLLITDHKNGLLAPVADASKLAGAMCEYAENPKLAETCGQNAKDVLVRFAPECIIDQWENYLRKLTKK